MWYVALSFEQLVRPLALSWENALLYSHTPPSQKHTLLFCHHRQPHPSESHQSCFILLPHTSQFLLFMCELNKYYTIVYHWICIFDHTDVVRVTWLLFDSQMVALFAAFWLFVRSCRHEFLREKGVAREQKLCERRGEKNAEHRTGTGWGYLLANLLSKWRAANKEGHSWNSSLFKNSLMIICWHLEEIN